MALNVDQSTLDLGDDCLGLSVFTEEIEEFAAEALILKGVPARHVIFGAAKKFPSSSGLSFSFALCCVASGTETHSSQEVDEIYRAVAVLSADLFELEFRGIVSPTGRDLLRHWFITRDNYFTDTESRE